MKKFIKLTTITMALSCIAAFVLLFSACTQVVELETPQIQINGPILTWSTIENATGYIIEIDGDAADIVPSDATSFSLVNLVIPGSYQIRVRALGDGINFLDSPWSDVLIYVLHPGGPTEPEPDPSLPRLPSPLNLRVDGAMLRWSLVPNSQGYIIDIAGTEYNSPIAQFSIAGGFAGVGGVQYIRVRAVGDDVNFSNSLWSTPISHTFIEPATEGLSFFAINNNTAFMVSGGTSTGSRIIIPDTHQGRPVTAIGGNAFWGRTELTSIYMPASINHIRNGAFQGAGLTRVTIPAAVVRIERDAFGHNDTLTDFIIPENSQLARIDDWAFFNARALTNLSTLPKTLSHFEGLAFVGTTSLTAINIHPDNPNFTSIDGIVFNKDMTRIVDYPVGRQGHFDIPSTVTTIGQRAFFQASGLTSITIPDSVTHINLAAFAMAENLRGELIIPNSVTYIGNNAFWWTDFDSIVFESDSQVASIGDNAFRGIVNIEKIDIPASVSSIGALAFSDTARLTQINVDSQNTVFSSINGVLFNKNHTTLIHFPQAKSDPYQIPSSVNTIGDGAFMGTILTSITIPNTITTIGISAFADPEGYSNLTIYAEAAARPAGWNLTQNTSFNPSNRPIIWGSVLSVCNTFVVSFLRTAASISNPGNYPISAPVRFGYVFSGWALSEGGTVAIANAANVHTAQNGQRLWAVWTAV